MSPPVQIVDPQWGIFDPMVVDNSTKSYTFTSQKPTSNPQNTLWGAQSTHEWVVSDSSYVNLSKSYIQVALQVQDATALAPYATGALVALCADASALLYTRLELIIGSGTIESTQSSLQRTAFIKDLMTVDGSTISSYRGSNLTDEFFILDDQGAQNNFAAGNAGFAYRQLLTDNGKFAMIKIPLSKLSGFCSVDRCLTNVPITLRLYTDKSLLPVNHAVSTGGVAINDAQLQIQSVDLMIAKLKPSLDVQSTISAQLAANTSQQISYQFWDTYTSNISANSSSFNTVVCSPSEKVDFVVQSFVPTAYLKTQTSNGLASSWFPNLLNVVAGNSSRFITQAYLLLGSVQVPMQQYFQVPSDNVKCFATYQDVAGRMRTTGVNGTTVLNYNDFFGPCSTIAATVSPNNTQYLNGGLAVLIYDCRHLDMENISGAKTLIPNIQFSAPLTADWTVYTTIVTERQLIISAQDRSTVVTKK